MLVLSHVREILEQDYEKFCTLWSSDFPPAGLHCAALGERDTTSAVIFASIQSAISRDLGPFDLVIVDEAHLVPAEGLGRYRTILMRLGERNVNVRLLGYTATPYRLDQGWLHKGEGALFTEIAYDLPIAPLIDQGYLAPLRSKAAKAGEIDLTGVHTRGGEYVDSEVEEAALTVVEAAVGELVRVGTAEGRKSWLIVCAGVRHAETVAELLTGHGVSNRTVFGTTDKKERRETIEAFRRGEFTALVGVSVFTIGFDVPRIDMLVLLRATKSTSLYVQIVGRAMRPSPDTGKVDALVLDHGGNVRRHGPINNVEIKEPASDDEGKVVVAPSPFKECPECGEFVGKATQVCPCCNYEWPVRHEAKADDAPVIAPPPEPKRVDVYGTTYQRHKKEGKPDSLRVTYCSWFGSHSEWVCLEHGGYAGEKAARWWLGRTTRPELPVPATVTDALIGQDELREVASIELVPDGRYERVGRVWFKDEKKDEDDGPGREAQPMKRIL